MASGGFLPNKPGKPETKRRSNWRHSVSSDRDDAQSLNSLPSDMRINNWDLSDLRPSNLGMDSKRRKKSKGNPEREREQSLSMDSPPHDKKRHTPTSYSRTKITSGTPKAHRVALENLKQQITFSDLEDQLSTDGERNNERQLSQSRRRLQNASFNRTGSDDDVRKARGRDRHTNRNNNMDYSSREQGPDNNEIVAHLLQIRDFTKQARSMLESMEKLGDRKKTEDIEKVRRLIRNLQEQEQGYQGLLQNTLAHDDQNEPVGDEDDAVIKMEEKNDSDDDTSVDLDVQTEESDTTEDSQDSRPQIESKLGIDSDVDEDGVEGNFGMQPHRGTGNSSDNANSNKTADLENTVTWGQFSLTSVPVQENEEGAKGATAIDGDAISSQQQELLRILREKQEQLRALMNRQEELNFKRREAEKKLFDAQARDNKARAALAAATTGRQFVEQRLTSATPLALNAELGIASWENEGEENESGTTGEDKQLKSNIVGYPDSDDEDNSKVCEVENLPNELQELRRQLNYLHNEFSHVSEAPKNVESDTHSSLAEGQAQLQNKLLELQNKKSHMDRLLQELQLLHSQPPDNLRNNGTTSQTSVAQPITSVAPNIPATRQQKQPGKTAASNVSSSSSLPARMNEVAAMAPSAVDNAVATFAHLASSEQRAEPIDSEVVNKVQEKMRQLKEVRGRLDQLKSLIQYYQGQKDETEDASSEGNIPSQSGLNDGSLHRQTSSEARDGHLSLQQQNMLQSQQQQIQELLRHHTQQRQGKENGANTFSSVHNMVQPPNLAGTDPGSELSDEDNASVSQSESQWSHLGPWDVDPEIQEKVRKLKAAKEKLWQLQDLVAFVQQSPDGSRALPDNTGDSAASIEGETVSHSTQTDEPSVSASDGERQPGRQRIPTKDDLNGIENPRAELERLRKERAMLLELQNQLQNIHNRVERASVAEVEEIQQIEPNVQGEKSELENIPSATIVTFASNDELYSKMRRQRILREELRSKKKELEAIMKKDRNKRQYSRNQDNHSDTVSMNTDTFGIPASVDATMATWGGSTVDNLENITEGEDGQERNDRVDGDEDDGYPSDGLVQAEEEEEENGSDDGTYTIEQDARLRKSANIDLGARPKTSRGRQAYPQHYRDNNAKSLGKQSSKRSSQNQRDGRSRHEDYGPTLDQRQEERGFQVQNYEWFRIIEDKLASLSSSVDTLLRKSDTEGKQLSVSLNQENATSAGNLMSPMQEQMLHLHSQSMMLSFGQLVQSLSHQQTDIQHLQQQMQGLQLQVQEIQHEHSFNAGPSGVSLSHLLHQAPSNTTHSGSNYNLRTSAAVGSHTLAFNHQQLPSPFTHSMNNTVPTGMYSEESTASPVHCGFQPGSLGLSTASLSLGLDRRTLTGSSGIGTSLSVNTGSNMPLPQPGFALTPTVSNMIHLQHHQKPHAGSSISAKTKEFSHFANTHQSTPTSLSNACGDSNNRFGSGSQLHQQSSDIKFPLSSHHEETNRSINQASKVGPYSEIKNMTRNYRSQMKNSESERASGLKMPSPKAEGFQNLDDGRHIGHQGWNREPTSGYRPVSSGAGLSNGSSCSSIQSIEELHSRLRREKAQAKSTDAAEDNTLFDTLRDTIFAEVASVISQNENRPHFLLELFRDMRQIDSDLMRQRALYSMQELLRPNLSSSTAASPSAHSWSKATNSTFDTGRSQQTPSESIASEDNDDLKVAQFHSGTRTGGRNQLGRLCQDGRPRNLPYDYAETADNLSCLSTPTNGGEESPSFQDNLADLAIEYDSLKSRGEERLCSSQSGFKRHKSQNEAADERKDLYEHIDMKQLDRQIKDIMMETIPVVKEHMEDLCTSKLLTFIKQLVLSLTNQMGSQEFVRLFQRQLASILGDVLQKYEGRKMKDCGEDLLVEISDILFNELAFFKLVQDLGDSNVAGRTRQVELENLVTKIENSSEHITRGNIIGTLNENDKNDRDKNNDGGTDETLEESNISREFRIIESEQERLMKGGDEELILGIGTQDTEGSEDNQTEQSYKIELAPSETKPYTRIGSDEDDDEKDEECNINDPCETAVSRDSRLEMKINCQPLPVPPLSVRPETEGAQGDIEEKQKADKLTTPRKVGQAKLVKPQGEVDCAEGQAVDGSTSAVHTEALQINGMVNGNNDNNNDEVTIDDLPERLALPTAVSNNSVELRHKNK